jgi:hypothetical protein
MQRELIRCKKIGDLSGGAGSNRGGNFEVDHRPEPQTCNLKASGGWGLISKGVIMQRVHACKQELGVCEPGCMAIHVEVDHNARGLPEFTGSTGELYRVSSG